MESCTEPHKARRLCRQHYQQQRRTGTLHEHTAIRTQRPAGLNLEDSLLSIGWDVDPDSGCWVWRGSRTSSGHGQLGFGGRVLKAHRASYLVHGRRLADGVSLKHRCGVRLCVNPEHLTTEKPTRTPPKPVGPAHGSRHGRSTLNEEDVAAIRQRWATGNWRQAELARRFGVSHAVVAAIVHGRTWRHVD
jgi:hypothetical protein